MSHHVQHLAIEALGYSQKLLQAIVFNANRRPYSGAVGLSQRPSLFRGKFSLRQQWRLLQIFGHGRMHVSRAKSGSPSVHPLSGRELRALRRLQREQEPQSPFVFTSERGSPFTPAGFRKMLARLGMAAKFDVPIHPHMLRHACGYKLANDGVDTRSLQAYLGHKNIQHTVRYTELAPTRFKDFWRD